MSTSSGNFSTYNTSALGVTLSVTVYANRGESIHFYINNAAYTPIKFRFAPAVGNGNLYYYCGNVEQNSHLVNVARIEEKLVDINSPSRGYLVESYKNGASWYRVYSDGWCEQGGTSGLGGYGLQTITFLKPFSDANYYFNNVITNLGGDWWTASTPVSGSAVTDIGGATCNRTPVSISIQKNSLQNWYACGY